MEIARCPFCKGTGFKTTSEIPPVYRRGMQPLTEPCHNCLGAARLPGDIPCPVCHGTGQKFIVVNDELTYVCNVCEGDGKVLIYTDRGGDPHSLVAVKGQAGMWGANSDSPECESVINNLLQRETLGDDGKEVVELMQRHGFDMLLPRTLSMDSPGCLFSHTITARVFYDRNGHAEDTA